MPWLDLLDEAVAGGGFDKGADRAEFGDVGVLEVVVSGRFTLRIGG